MKVRLTRGLALIPIGVVILVTLFLVGESVYADLYNTAVRVTVSAKLSLSEAPQGSDLSAAYSNQGNRPALLSPLAIPLLLVDGVPFAVGASWLDGSATGSAGGTSVSVGTPPDESSCIPELALSAPIAPGYAWVSGASPMGPMVLSAVFQGSPSWPSMGYGLLLANNLSGLFVVQVAGGGNTTATVAYENFSESVGTVTGQFARSPPFEINTNVAMGLTVALTGLGGFVALVDGIPRLNGSIEPFLPGPSFLGVWAQNDSSVAAVVTSGVGSTLWEGLPSDCGFLSVTPLVSNAQPYLLTNSTTATIVGPFSEPGVTGGSLYVLEELSRGSAGPATATLAGCNPVSLDVDGSLTFTAPWAV